MVSLFPLYSIAPHGKMEYIFNILNSIKPSGVCLKTYKVNPYYNIMNIDIKRHPHL